MGYIGQHLTSVVTGFPGGRSGARGHDLELPDDKYAEIKTCYRVDQLGACVTCGAAVSSVEFVCPRCGGTTISRKDDSKWLIGIRNDDEMRELFDPEAYYLVLFDLSEADEEAREEAEAADNQDGEVEVITDRPLDINARIWEVDPRHPGFALCMVDYRFNIQTKSTSKAPFNFWPYALKFQLMNPLLIYHAVIRADDTIQTLLFPGAVGLPQRYPLMTFSEMSGSWRNLGNDKLVGFAAGQGVAVPATPKRAAVLAALDAARVARGWTDEWLKEQLAEVMYRSGIVGRDEWLPEELRASV
jgi:predicted RNA-binding Zn-ribbon protein involved in translation (DUF1610 family)